MKVLFFGDIVGKIGRQALKQVLPMWRSEYQPDAIIGNAEDLAHGSGVTRSTLDELKQIGFSGFTLGDHTFDRQEVMDLFIDKSYHLARPANFPPSTPGSGYFILPVGNKRLAVVSILGRVFFKEQYDCPFRAMDQVLAELDQQDNVAGIIVDFHAEATSEKIAMGWYLDGKVSAVVGSHTHVMTADDWLLPQGTAYITDIGMTGGKDGVIGVKKELSLQRFLTALPIHFEPVEEGLAQVNAVLVEIESNNRSVKIKRLTEVVTI